MNTFRKMGDVWAIQTDAQHEPGAEVTVTLKSGATKVVTLAEQIGTYRDSFIYATAPRENAKAVAVGEMSGVLAMFASAKAKLKYPAVVLSVPAAYVGDGLTIRLSVAGPKAKVPGSITVLDANKNADGERDWFGRITTDGAFQPSNKLNGRTEAIAARLREFAAEPARVAAEHGRLTGSCCFCNRALKDERSTAVGYGKVCAEHYDLPW